VSPDLLHATAVAIGGHGVLLLGASGSGKSDLALRLIDRGATLVSDDAVPVDDGERSPILMAAPNIEGKIEVRGVGICAADYTTPVPLRLIVELTSDVERMPATEVMRIVGAYHVPTIKLAPFEVSAAIKLEYALRSVVDADRWPVAILADSSEGRTI
jgi:HPr kinase/phosphorylase